MSLTPLRLAAACAGVLGAGGAGAHHGFGNFDRSREVSLEGTITSIDFVNPHAYVYFEATNPDGTKVAKRCEMRAATVLRRSGWTAEMFKAGEPIKIEGAPDRFDVNSCYVHTVVFADGTAADRYAQLSKPAATAAPAAPRAARLPSGEPNITGDWAPEQRVMTDPRGRSGALVPVSQVDDLEPGASPAPPGGAAGGGGAGAGAAGGAGGGGPRARVTYTEAGQAAADAFRNGTTDNPRMRCETTSILFDWTFDGPVNRITQSGDTITLQYGQLGLTRTIRMNVTEHPANIEPSRTGHSIGRWANDVLVVDTVGFAPGVLNPPIMNSVELHVVERFTLDPSAMTLTREYTATDPVYYTDQYSGSDTIGIADLPYAPDPCSELTFVDFSADGVAPDASSGGIGPQGPQGAAAAPAQNAAAPPAAAQAEAAEEKEEGEWWEFWKWFD
jgi:Family of unknown function (DUF6152)